jgi:outer membrane protein TolC
MENQEALLLDLGLRYIDWVLLEQQRQIGQERLNLSEEQLDHLKEKREANLVDEVDVLRAEDARRIAYQNVVLLDANISAKKAELSILARTPSITESAPAFDLYSLVSQMDPVVEFQRVAQESRVLNALKIAKDGLVKRKGGLRDTEKPILNLNVGLGLKSGDDRFGDSWGADKPDFTVAFEFLHQLGSRGAKNDVARAEIQIDQLDAQIEEVSISLEAAVHSVLIRIRELEEVLALNLQEIQSAHDRTEEETRLYDQGRGDLTFVIQSRDNEQNARLRYASNAADYHRLLLQFREIADDLL